MAQRDRSEVFEVVRTNIYEVLPDIDGQEIGDEDRLVDLGANSMERAEIVMMAMEELSLQVPRAELSTTRNIGELVDTLYAKSRGR